MKMLKFTVFAVVTYIYFGGLVLGGIGLVSDLFDYTPWSMMVTNIAILIMFVTQATWGVVVGTICHYRGWEVVGGWKNLPAMIVLESTVFTIPSMVLGMVHYFRVGKFFPTPQEC